MLSVLFQRVLRLFQDAPYSTGKTSNVPLVQASTARVQAVQRENSQVQQKDSQAHSWDGDFFLFYGLMRPRFGTWVRYGRAGFPECFPSVSRAFPERFLRGFRVYFEWIRTDSKVIRE